MGELKCNDIPSVGKDQTKTILASICNSGLRGNAFVSKELNRISH